MSDNGKITWHTEQRRLGDLVEWDKNPRQLSEHDAKHIKTSLDKFGVADPLIINLDGSLIGGHQRKRILDDPDLLVDVRVPDRQLDEREAEELAIRLNKNTGAWDFDMLANNFDVPDLLEWGFTEEELQIGGFDLEDEKPEDPGAQMDKAEELREKWGVESGQLWQLGEHRLICGDCTDKAVVERVMGGEKAVLLWTDPPYHVGKKFEQSIDEGTEWDNEFQQGWQDTVYPFVDKGCQRYVCFAQAQSTNAILFYEPKRLLIWCKPFALMRSNTYDWAYEFVSWSYDGEHPEYFVKPDGTKSFDWQEIASVIHGQEGKWHITQKPLALPELHIEASCPIGGIVFDPFVGSGTTLIACERLGRKCRAVEISPAYCAVAIQRWVDMTGGKPVVLE